MLSNIEHGLQHFGCVYIALAPEIVRSESYYIALSDGKTTWYLGTHDCWMNVYNESMLLTWNQTEHYFLHEQRPRLLQGIALQVGHIAKKFDMKTVCLNLVKLDTNVIVDSVWIEEYITKRAQLVPISMAMNLPPEETRDVYAVGQQHYVFDNHQIKPEANAWNIPTVKEFRKRHDMDIVTYKVVMDAVEALFAEPKMWDQRQISGNRYYWALNFAGKMSQDVLNKVKLDLTAKGWEILWGCKNGEWDLSLYVNKEGK